VPAPLTVVRHLVGRLRGDTPGWALVAAAILLAAVVLAGLLVARTRARYQTRMATGARCVTILAPPTPDPAGPLALWANLLGLLRPRLADRFVGGPHVAWEYVVDHAGVRIQLWVPGVIPAGLVERAVEAAWPGARTRTRPADPPLPPGARAGWRQLTAGGECRLALPAALPIRTDHPSDPARPLLAAAAGLAHHEHAVVQILARPAGRRRATRGPGEAGEPARGPGGLLRGAVLALLDLASPGRSRARPGRAGPRPDPRAALEQAAADRAAAVKARGPHYATLVRYAVTTTFPDPAAGPAPGRRSRRPAALAATPPGTGGTDDDPEMTRPDLGAWSPADRAIRAEAALRGRAHALAAGLAAYTAFNHYRRRRLRQPRAVLAARTLPRRADILSLAELAALAHLPTGGDIAGLERAGARAVPPPAGVPSGPAGPGIRLLGRSDSGRTRPVGIRVADGTMHTQMIGSTGSGKSELMARMALADADAGRGFVLVDPKGDLVTDILDRLPETAADRVTLIDAQSARRPPILNPLDTPDRHGAVDSLVHIFAHVFADGWGARTDDILRVGLLTLCAQPGTPLLRDLPTLLHSPAFRDRAMKNLPADDQILRGF